MGTVPHRQTVGEVIIIYEDREGGEVSGGHVILVGILVGILAAHYLFPASTSGEVRGGGGLRRVRFVVPGLVASRHAGGSGADNLPAFIMKFRSSCIGGVTKKEQVRDLIYVPSLIKSDMSEISNFGNGGEVDDFVLAIVQLDDPI